jgi:diguanylate cyclase (GGDEF)-like protein
MVLEEQQENSHRMNARASSPFWPQLLLRIMPAVPNRRALVELIEKNLVAGTPFAVALLDLDGFKDVNDRLGHPVGDALLRVVGNRLAAGCGSAGTVGRLGGDEFMVVLDATDLSARITTMLDTLCQPTQLAGEAVMVQASLGHSLFPRDGTTTATLLAAADAALYANKRERKGPATEAQAEAAAAANRRRHRTS